MNRLLSFITFFLVNLSIYAQNSNAVNSQLEKVKTASVSQMEVYIWGGIFFCLSIGSLLLIVHLFPKSDEYKRQLAARKAAAKAGLSGAKPTQKKPVATTPVKQEKKEFIDEDPTTMITKVAETATTMAQETIQTAPTIKTELQNTAPPSQPTIKTELQHTEPSKATVGAVTSTTKKQPVECKIVSNDGIFKSRNIETETMCKELLNKLQSLVDCKSISVYFVKNGQFTRYIEKKQDVFSLYDPITERADVSEDVIKFLKKKLGAFSSTHSDAVLPMVNNDQLFGAVKLQFKEPQKGLNINTIWGEVKSFAKFFQQSNKTTSPSIDTKEPTLYTIEHFNNILNYRVTLDINQNLTLIKVLNVQDKSQVLSQVADSLKNILGKKPEVYKVSDDTAGIFLTIENREKLGKSLAELLGQLRKIANSVDLCVGSSDYHSSFKFPQKWYEKALQALNEAVNAGPNNYKLLVEKG